MNEPIRILQCRKRPANFVGVELHARDGERDATGARVSSEYSGRTLVRWMTKGHGFFSESDPQILFPVDAERSEIDIAVQWPGRAAEAFRGLSVRRTHHLVEGRGAPLP
jgi:hypothetical protein